ncbi:MAG TPA: thioredoxin domain-containing protein [Polyangiaceae bacterium]|nr:thioredoxin domain-containing protein [Polyangiaceae bacterium]
MWSLRVALVAGVATLMSARLTTCRSPGEGGGTEPNPAKSEAADVTLPGVDTSALTTREKAEWSRYVSEFLSPCADQPVSIAECVKQSRPCKACSPAARYVAELSRRGQVRSQVEAAYKARFSPEAVHTLDLAGSPSKGPANAKVVIAEWADFQCPACKAAAPIVEAVLEHHPNDVRLVFKHFPLTIHEHAEKAARASVAALKQNKFWEMHHALFDAQPRVDPENVESLAKGLGLDMKRFAADRDSEATADVVARDRKQGEALALKSTPSIFVNGRQFVPGGESDDLEEWVKLELELVGASASAPAAPAASNSAPASPGSAPSAAPAASTAPSPSAHTAAAPAASAKPKSAPKPATSAAP